MRTTTILSLSCLFVACLANADASAARQDAPTPTTATAKAPDAFYALVKEGKGE